MYLKDVGWTLLRRWYLTVIGLASTVGLCLAALALVPPTYEAKASVVLLPPKTSIVPGGNPYLQLGGLQQAVDVLVKALGSETTAGLVKQKVPSAEFTVESDLSTSGPIMVVTADDSTSTGASATLEAVLDAVPSTLKNLQSTLDISRDAQITSMILTRDDIPTTVSKNPIRAALAAGAAGVVATVLLVALADGLLLRRRRSPRHRSDDDPFRPDGQADKSSSGDGTARAVEPLAEGDAGGDRDPPPGDHVRSGPARRRPPPEVSAPPGDS